MPVHVRTLASVLVVLGAAAAAGAQGRDILPPVPTPTDIKPGSITCDECPYPVYERILQNDYQSTRRSLSRYVGHDPSAWNDKFELYTRIRSSWTLSSDFPRLAMVQAIISQMLYQDPVVYDWPHMQVLADTVPNGNGRTLLFPGLGHVPHLERPDIIVPALVEYLMEGVE